MTRPSARSFFTLRHYITPSARNLRRTPFAESVRKSVLPARTRNVNANNTAALTRRSRPGERSLPETSRSLDRVAALMGVPRPVKDEAGLICKKALEKGLVRGRSIEAIVAAAVYAACRIDGVPRTLDELQQVTGVRKKTIGKAYGALLRTLTLRVPPSRPMNYVSRFCSRLGLSNTVEAEAQKILKELEKIDSSMSLSPSGTATAPPPRLNTELETSQEDSRLWA